MEPVYFESSVFLAVISGEKNGPQIRSLLRELKNNRVRIYTSIITLQEISVLSFRRGTVADDTAAKLHKMARIAGITKEIALTAAKLEAQLKDLGKLPKEQEQINENRRRKWDCFHIAAAMCLKCSTVFSFDKEFLKRKGQLGIESLEFSEPVPRAAELDLRLLEPEREADGKSKKLKPSPSPVQGGAPGPAPSEAGAKAAEAEATQSGEIQKD